MNNDFTNSPLVHFILAAVVMFFAMFLLVPVFFAVVRLFGFYTIVEERQCKVYMLFGKVVAVIDQPGLHLLILKLGIKAPLVTFLGKCHVLDLRLDQEYLRSNPVNSEEGAPMGIGVWYEMFISDPVSYLFKNADPRGSRGQRQQRHRPLPQQHEARRHAGKPPSHEHDRPHRSHPAIAGMGLQPRLRLYPQSPFPRCRHDQAD